MLKIGDFSRFSRVSVKALRYYDEIGLLKPVEVDRFTGYRYYSADQLPRLNRIVNLKDLGLSLEEVSQLLDESLTADRMVAILRAKQAEIEQRLLDGQGQLAKLGEWLKRVEKEVKMPAYEVVIKKVDRQTVVSVRDVIPTYGDVGRLFGEVFGYLGSQGVNPIGPPLPRQRVPRKGRGHGGGRAGGGEGAGQQQSEASGTADGGPDGLRSSPRRLQYRRPSLQCGHGLGR
jgi:DNA-binding transcriptional MerR regulator